MKKLTFAVLIGYFLSASAMAEENKKHIFLLMDVANTSLEVKTPEDNEALNDGLLHRISRELKDHVLTVFYTSEPHKVAFKGNAKNFKRHSGDLYAMNENTDRKCSDLALSYERINDELLRLRDDETARVIIASAHIDDPYGTCGQGGTITIPQEVLGKTGEQLKRLVNNSKVESVLHARLEGDQFLPLSRFYDNAGQDLLTTKVKYLSVRETNINLGDKNYKFIGDDT